MKYFTKSFLYYKQGSKSYVSRSSHIVYMQLENVIFQDCDK